MPTWTSLCVPSDYGDGYGWSTSLAHYSRKVAHHASVI
nr:MAG TPA: hypothetical protein [Caudoviricetes sp.]